MTPDGETSSTNISSDGRVSEQVGRGLLSCPDRQKTKPIVVTHSTIFCACITLSKQ